MTDRLDEWKSEWVSGKMSDQLTWWINELWIDKTGGWDLALWEVMIQR